jgi:uncharacterized protein (TIGR02001 family)
MKGELTMKLKALLSLMLVFTVYIFVPGAHRAWAEEENKGILDPSYFSATTTIATDYVFRGISQTNEDPAIQGSLDYAHPIGLYVGVWGSNVDDSISKGNIELDFYGGYKRELFKDFSCDLSLIYYLYPGSGDDPEANYVEGHVGLSYVLSALPLAPTIGVGYNYSPDFFGEDGKAHYVNGKLGLSLPYGFGLSGEVGYQWVEGDKLTGHGQGEDGGDGFDYTHWRVGLSKELLGFNLDLSYHNTNEEKFLGKVADERVVFMISRTF